MHEHELWLTALFNQYLGGLGNSILAIFGMKAENPAHPWQNWIVMELLVFLALIVLVAMVRSSFSVDKPGKLQHLFETVYTFLKTTAGEVGIHDEAKYVNYFGTVFVFILFMNLLGIIPTFESPTMNAAVPAGLAICTFAYFNGTGFRANGIGYLKHFVGPVVLLAPLMIPIELMGTLARPLSLTIRLYANMFAGEQVTLAFLGLTYLVIPVIFMALHVFVSLLQAYIFTLLTMIYVSGSTAHEH